MLETTFLSGFPESLENTKQECALMGKRLEWRRSENVRERMSIKPERVHGLFFIFREEVASSLRDMSSVPKETGPQGLELQFL